MKNFDSRTYSVNDFVEWNKTEKLTLNPRFQRRSVWNDKARSYLIDTIFRGKPFPKIFLRQLLDISKKTSIREIVDGQQRLRTILDFVADKFVVPRVQNPDYGGLFFSNLPPEAQEAFLNYEIAVDLLINVPNEEILDIFSRLNSYAVVLNEQEHINAHHWGPFKMLADEIGFKYSSYFVRQGVLTDKRILRMAEVTLVADLLIAMKEGIKSIKQIKKYYDLWEKEKDAPANLKTMGVRFDRTISKIDEIYPEGLKKTEFKRPILFYSLFTAVLHSLYGLPELDEPRISLSKNPEINAARKAWSRVGELFKIPVEELGKKTSVDEQQFLTDCRRATTDEIVRVRRTRFILNLV